MRVELLDSWPWTERMDLGDELITLDPVLLAVESGEFNPVASLGQHAAYLEDGACWISRISWYKKGILTGMGKASSGDDQENLSRRMRQ